MRTIKYNNEYWKLHDNGMIERPNLVAPSKTWVVTGACEYNNFGHVVRVYSLDEILNTNIQWKHKNGKQKVFIRDNDHGTNREWRNSHTIF